MTEPQIIHDNKDNPLFAVIPWQEYQHLKMGNSAPMLADEALYSEAKSSDDEILPIEIADRLLAGDNPVKIYRKLRGMTQRQLATAVNINSVYLSQIETGKRSGSAKTLTAISRVLNVFVEDLRP